ncbi:DnaK family member protein [Theileria equi strain WA]|uniref:DnaK family member protein n=1 Tax=Theileria equi strain WA TaxID=1537102 RepID=L0AVQ2_THEEQ|nr:DnaK family member protein [Theileria equi strain WA]AFZ79106.1 DnaK family member protein [Theileria equi strain WA]|eukprot:XP_004828772.1 DnaK family member protein [Theileria equi strain WA]
MPVIGVDIGSSTSTVATISKGAIDIVLNDVSQRYTPTCLSYAPLQRLFGDQSQSQIVSNFKNSCRGFMSMLGVKLRGQDRAGEFSVTELDEFFSSTPLKLDDNGVLSYQIANGSSVSTKSTLSALIGYISFLTEMSDSYTGALCREAVFSYPSWFSELQKNYLSTCARAAGLNCLKVISEGTAMALDYGMYRLKQLSDEAATTVALVMIGHSHATLTIVDFFASHCVVLSEVSDKYIGGRTIDYILMSHMASEFSKKYKIDPLSNVKTKLKVEAVALKAKRVLSANSEASYSAECLMEDYDLAGTIKRDEFEKLCESEFLPRLTTMLNEGIKLSGRSVDSISAVEIAGGITRIPCVQAIISGVFNKPLSKTLNADECIARGCVLEAAISSKHYMVRQYKVVEQLSRPLTICCLPGLGDHTEKDLVTAKCYEVAPAGSKKSDVFSIRLEAGLPCTIFASLDDPRDPSGVHALGSFRLNATSKEGGEDEGLAIKCGFDEFGSFYLLSESCEVAVFPAHTLDLDTLSALEKEESKKDKTEVQRLKTLNDFETFIYSVRDKMQDTHKDFVEPKNVEKIAGAVNHWQDWLYSNSGASQEVLQEGFDKVSEEWKSVEHLYNVYTEKELELETFYKKLQNYYNFCCDDKSPRWGDATAEERLSFAKRLIDLDSSIREAHEKEVSQPKYLSPLFTMAQVEIQLKIIADDIEKFCNDKKKVAEVPKEDPPTQEADPKEFTQDQEAPADASANNPDQAPDESNADITSEPTEK